MPTLEDSPRQPLRQTANTRRHGRWAFLRAMATYGSAWLSLPLLWWLILSASLATDAPDASAFVSAYVVPPVVLLAVWLLMRGLRWRADATALRRIGLEGVTAQGRRVAVVGTVECLGEPVHDPVLRRKAVACHYKVFETGSRTAMENEGGTTKSMRILRAEGWRMAPCRIVTREGRVTLGGMLDLEAVQRLESRSGGSYDLQSPHFERASRWPRALWRARLLAGPRRTLDANFRGNPVKKPDKLWGSSRSLKEGEPVCVVGRVEGGRLLPELNRPLGIPVYPGTAEEVLTKVHDDADVFVKCGGFLLGTSICWTTLLLLLL